jgi:predicted ATPase
MIGEISKQDEFKSAVWYRDVCSGIFKVRKMWIKKIHIENYKSLKEVDIELNEGVNVFIGKNNTGKSNTVGALMFLSDVVSGGGVDLYNQYNEIVFGKDVKNEIKFDLEFTVSDTEMEDIFSKFQLEPDISFGVFKNSILNEIGYATKLGDHNNSFTLLEEEVCIYFKGKRVVFAKSFWNNGAYNQQIIENLKEGINTNLWDSFFNRNRGPTPNSVLHAPISRGRIMPVDNLLLSLYNFIAAFKNLNPIRSNRESMEVYGGVELKSDGSNLPQVLNSIVSGDRELFDTIMDSAGRIVEEIAEIRAPLKKGTSETYISTVEPSFEGMEFTWEHIASGTKEILYLITLLHTTPNGSLLLIEEPEMHLHPDAVHKFLSSVEKISSEDHKQVLITTHSPVLLDAVSFDKIFTVLKESGKTTVEQLKGQQAAENMLFQAGIPKSWLLLSEMPLFLLIVEGRDDNKIWRRFLQKTGMNLITNRVSVVSPGDSEDKNGGYKEAIKLGIFIKKARIPTPFMIVLDSDGERRRVEKEKELRQARIPTDKYYILNEKEIESYLLDPVGISGVTTKNVSEVEEAMSNSKRGGKEKLDDVFTNLGLDKPPAETKALIVLHMANIPDEIVSIIDKIKTKI